MIDATDEATKVINAGPDIRPLRIFSDLPECIVSAAGTDCAFTGSRREWRSNLPNGCWLEIQYGQYTLDSWHALEWRGESRLYLRESGPGLFVSAENGAAGKLVGIDARTPPGLRLLKSQAFARDTGALSILLSRLDKSTAAALTNVNVASIKLESAENLDLLSKLKTLRFLNISTLPVTDFSVFQSLSNLTVLDASYCSALRNISALRKLKALRVLDLAYCEFLDNISPLLECSRLTTLNLGGCAWLAELSGLYCLKNLRLLSVLGCPNLSNASLDRLQRALPECAILRGATSAKGIEEAVRIGTLRIEVAPPFIGDGI